jgi:hypothetical protein
MRSTEATPGETYRLRSRSRIKVEMLDTPAEVRAARRMRVRFLTGVKAGSVSDIPSVAIAPLPESESGPAAPQKPEPTAPMLVPASGPLRAGATVVLDDDKAGFHWKIKRLLPDGMVEISTTIFERPTNTTVSRDRVQLIGQRRRSASERDSAKTADDRRADAFDQTTWMSKNLRPVQPRRHLDIVAESVVLGPRCLHYCRNRFYRDSSLAECADRFRAEIRIKGLIQRDRKRGLLEGRIRVHGRFELVLPADFHAGTAITIEDPSAIIDLRPRSERPERSSTKPRRGENRARPRRRRRKRLQSQ